MSKQEKLIPLNLGNKYSVTKFLEVQEQLLDEKNRKIEFNKDQRRWNTLLMILQQLAGMFSVEGHNNLKAQQNRLFQTLFFDGYVGLMYDKKVDKFIVCEVGKLTPDAYGGWEKVQLRYASGLNQDGYKKSAEFNDVSGNDCVVIRCGVYGFSFFVMWDQFIKEHVELMSIYLLNARLNIKKLQRIINNDSADIMRKETESIISSDDPFVLTYNPITTGKGNAQEISKEQNVIAPLDLSNGNYSFDDVVNHWEFNTNLLGLFADTHTKKERKTVGENNVEQANTILIHETWLRELKSAEKEIKDKFGVSVTFDKTFEFDNENDDGDLESKDDDFVDMYNGG